jgi:hypothetical protein
MASIQINNLLSQHVLCHVSTIYQLLLPLIISARIVAIKTTNLCVHSTAKAGRTGRVFGSARAFLGSA